MAILSKYLELSLKDVSTRFWDEVNVLLYDKFDKFQYHCLKMPGTNATVMVLTKLRHSRAAMIVLNAYTRWEKGQPWFTRELAGLRKVMHRCEKC